MPGGRISRKAWIEPCTVPKLLSPRLLAPAGSFAPNLKVPIVPYATHLFGSCESGVVHTVPIAIPSGAFPSGKTEIVRGFGDWLSGGRGIVSIAAVLMFIWLSSAIGVVAGPEFPEIVLIPMLLVLPSQHASKRIPKGPSSMALFVTPSCCVSRIASQARVAILILPLSVRV